MDKTAETRLAELEIQMGLAEDHLNELNLTIFRQQQQIDLLQGQMRELQRQLHATSASDAGEPRTLREELPPHY